MAADQIAIPLPIKSRQLTPNPTLATRHCQFHMKETQLKLGLFFFSSLPGRKQLGVTGC